MRGARRQACLCLLVAVGACKRAPVVSAPAPGAGLDAGYGKTAATAARSAEQAAVEKLLWDWVAAQNEGDFAGYQAHYAASFQVVDHAGKRPRTLKSAAWMQGQRRLFAKPQTVTTRDEQVRATGDLGEIQLARTVDSGTYHEESERRLSVRREAEGWRITREEVLSSKVDPSRGRAMTDMAYALIWEDDVVLADATGDAFVVGRPRLREAQPSVAVARVDEGSLPASLLQWKRERLRLIDAELGECEATVTGFEVIAHSEWDMGTIQTETGSNDRKTAAKVWEAKHMLVAKLNEREGSCQRPQLARPARLPRGQVVAFADVDDEIRDAATALFDQLPEVAKRTRQVKSESPDWDQAPRVFLADAGKAGRFLSVQNLGPAGCGEPGFYADAVWRSSPDGRKAPWELVRSPDEGKALSPVLILDDGTSELRIVYRGELRMGVLHWEDGKLSVDQELEVPYLDCRC